MIERTAPHGQFRIPERISDIGDDQIEAYLSGRSLLAVLATMQETYLQPEQDMATWALASAIYRRTQHAVEVASRKAPASSTVTTVVLDDRPGPDGNA